MNSRIGADGFQASLKQHSTTSTVYLSHKPFYIFFEITKVILIASENSRMTALNDPSYMFSFRSLHLIAESVWIFFLEDRIAFKYITRVMLLIVATLHVDMNS